ncbi:MAG: DUF4468 domain-containing protein [Bacteroidales bacterium]|nr:DUF4468 domain-containing protein [Bacteroidales bacterium]
MKNILLIITFNLFVFNSFSQNNELKIPKIPVDANTKLINYSKVVNEKGIKDSLYQRGLKWFNSYYKNPTDVIREKDTVNHKITGKARMPIFDDAEGTKLSKGNIEYTIILEFKDDRFRYSITNLNLKQASYFALEKWLKEKDNPFAPKCYFYLEQVNTYMNNLTDNLKKAMKPVIKKEDNW